MNQKKLRELLANVAAGDVSPEQAMERLRLLPFEDIGFAKIDHHRALRKGYPETIFCMGKTTDQVVEIVSRIRAHGSYAMATRCEPGMAQALLAVFPDAVYHEVARIVSVGTPELKSVAGFAAIVCAGTSDIPVAEEAAVSCESMGTTVKRIYDVGVAGIHRVLEQHDTLMASDAIVVCAGMEGALASVVAGLVDKPVIAVPTSVGYGASFGGIAALLTMLNSCATGVVVVNIDNGYGAGMFAGIIHRIAHGISP